MNVVTNEIKEQIRIRYPYENTKELAKELGISPHTVMKWASKFKLKKDKNVFKYPNSISEQEEKLLEKYYPSMPVEDLEKLFNRNMHAIGELARRRGIKRELNSVRKGTLDPLLSSSIESFYWLGFLAADGYISNTGHLLVSQVEKDKETIFKLAEYLNTSVYEHERISNFNGKLTKYYRVNICDKLLGRQIRTMWGLSDSDKKTYTGINLDFIKSENQACAFLIGFLDGDGWYNKKNKTYKTECHGNWMFTLTKLNYLLPKVCRYEVKLKYRKDKDTSYAVFVLNTKQTIYIRKFAKSNNIGSKRKFLD